ncbi:hypothetical protein LB503_013311 [Fusarium chuoi]|nr:hypothetical protein LB503_013311 [Fusarium chuoi]
MLILSLINIAILALSNQVFASPVLGDNTIQARNQPPPPPPPPPVPPPVPPPPPPPRPTATSANTTNKSTREIHRQPALSQEFTLSQGTSSTTSPGNPFLHIDHFRGATFQALLRWSTKYQTLSKTTGTNGITHNTPPIPSGGFSWAQSHLRTRRGELAVALWLVHDTS